MPERLWATRNVATSMVQFGDPSQVRNSVNMEGMAELEEREAKIGDMAKQNRHEIKRRKRMPRSEAGLSSQAVWMHLSEVG